jgi:hypothetical protein
MINDLLLKSLTNFYNKNDNMENLYKILKNQNKASLRLVDWFTTNYSKKYNIIYLLYKDEYDRKTINETDNIISQFNVYNSYKSQLKAYSKKQFDPFCRRERINFTCCNKKINTTVGQLNFFKWVINNHIMEYIEANIDDIETDMNDSLKTIKKNYKKVDNSRKPRQELSKSALRGLNKIPMKVSITFD